jgi:hypothetical protein
MEDVIRLEPNKIRQLIRFDGANYYWLPRPIEMFLSERSWKIWNSRFANTQTLNTSGGKGYHKVTIFGRSFKSHRVIYAFHKGIWPVGEIDHINGIRDDNRIENLRDASHQENCKNQSGRIRSASGVRGVHWCRATKRWQAQIGSGGKKFALGRFDSLEAAAFARRKAEIEHGFRVYHGLLGSADAKG